MLRVFSVLALLLLFTNSVLCFSMSDTYVSRRSTYTSTNNYNRDIVDLQPLVIFQFLDESFLPIWHNWIAIALHFQIFDVKTEYYLSCFGSPKLNDRVKLLYAPGCSSHRIATPETYKRIYLAKWTALVEAFIFTKKNMLLIDIDALLLKNPRDLFSDTASSSLVDIISSTDHGHSRKQFHYGHNWGHIRLCTGFIWFRYSVDMAELLQIVHEYQEEYGQGDQIAFNNVLAQFGVIWDGLNPRTSRQQWNTRITGEVLWLNQSSTITNISPSTIPRHKYVSEFATQESSVVTSDKITTRLRIKLLEHHTVMRYCDKKGDPSYDVRPLQHTALHCFDSTRVPSAGWKRAHLKAFTFQSLALWVLKWEYTPSYTRVIQEPGTSPSNKQLQQHHHQQHDLRPRTTGTARVNKPTESSQIPRKGSGKGRGKRRRSPRSRGYGHLNRDRILYIDNKKDSAQTGNFRRSTGVGESSPDGDGAGRERGSYGGRSEGEEEGKLTEPRLQLRNLDETKVTPWVVQQFAESGVVDSLVNATKLLRLEWVWLGIPPT